MGKFKMWLEDFQGQKQQEIQKLWKDTFQALGIGGINQSTALNNSISGLQSNSHNPNDHSVFKGKQAVSKALAPIFQRLQATNDPELRKNVELTQKWLDSQKSDGNEVVGGGDQVKDLFQHLFGQYYNQLSDKDSPKDTTPPARAQVPAMPPIPTPQDQPNPPQQPTTSTPPGQQQQAMSQPVPPVPQPPLPKAPMGADQGLF